MQVVGGSCSARFHPCGHLEQELLPLVETNLSLFSSSSSMDASLHALNTYVDDSEARNILHRLNEIWKEEGIIPVYTIPEEILRHEALQDTSPASSLMSSSSSSVFILDDVFVPFRKNKILYHNLDNESVLFVL